MPDPKTLSSKYYVLNPITLGDFRYSIHVLGYNDTKGHTAPYTITRGHVIDAAGAGPAIEKWLRNGCIEPYDAEKHDAILEPVPVPAPTLPTWFDEPEPGREIEREMRESERRGGRW